MKKIIITIVIGFLAATIVGFLYFRNLDISQQGTGETMNVEEGETLTLTTDENIKGKNSIMSLFKLGKSMECTFVFSSDGMRGEGTGFFDNGNARVDSLYSATGSMPTASYMITDAANKIMYTWTLDNGVAQGVKMAIPDDAPESAADKSDMPVMGEANSEAVTPETDVEYNCKPWTVDSSVFVPPTDVEFMDMTDMQKQMEDMMQGIPSMTNPNL